MHNLIEVCDLSKTFTLHQLGRVDDAVFIHHRVAMVDG
jgi:alpha-D-ribose 1-methylphosphonate 5-triphosphate synthase subunit PhnL